MTQTSLNLENAFSVLMSCFITCFAPIYLAPYAYNGSFIAAFNQSTQIIYEIIHVLKLIMYALFAFYWMPWTKPNQTNT